MQLVAADFADDYKDFEAWKTRAAAVGGCDVEIPAPPLNKWLLKKSDMRGTNMTVAVLIATKELEFKENIRLVEAALFNI